MAGFPDDTRGLYNPTTDEFVPHPNLLRGLGQANMTQSLYEQMKNQAMQQMLNQQSISPPATPAAAPKPSKLLLLENI